MSLDSSLSAGIMERESALERDFETLRRFLDAGAMVTSQPDYVSASSMPKSVGVYPNRERVSDLRTPVSETRQTDNNLSESPPLAASVVLPRQ